MGTLGGAYVGGREIVLPETPPSAIDPGLLRYYGSGAVRARVAEYADGAFGLAGYGGSGQRRDPDDWGPVPLSRADASVLFREGADVCRSMADANGTLLLLDVDYTNADDPAEPYREPESVFERLEPVYSVVRDALEGFHVRPLVLMTARGWHFVARVPRGGELLADLATLGILPPSQRTGDAPSDAVGRAHAGAGKLVEHLAHRILSSLPGSLPVAVDLADVPAAGRGGLVCLDLSAYADPVRTRFSRTAFSSNQKSRMAGLAPERPFVAVVPRDEMTLAELLAIRGDLEAAARLAERRSARIPDVPAEAHAWLDDYERGPLVRLHTDLDEAWDEPEPAPEPDLDALPACAAWPLRHPDPALLQPGYIRTVTLALRAHGWPPAAVARVIQNRYENEPGLRALFRRYDAASRAAFYVRLFCGTVEAGLEIHDNFTCATQASRGLCRGGACGHDLARLFDSLHGRRDLP